VAQSGTCTHQSNDGTAALAGEQQAPDSTTSAVGCAKQNTAQAATAIARHLHLWAAPKIGQRVGDQVERLNSTASPLLTAPAAGVMTAMPGLRRLKPLN
jgi:hypothetical protein